jgi:hypothetical protein
VIGFWTPHFFMPALPSALKRSLPFAAVVDYQKHRVKKLKKQNKT